MVGKRKIRPDMLELKRSGLGIGMVDVGWGIQSQRQRDPQGEKERERESQAKSKLSHLNSRRTVKSCRLSNHHKTLLLLVHVVVRRSSVVVSCSMFHMQDEKQEDEPGRLWFRLKFRLEGLQVLHFAFPQVPSEWPLNLGPFSNVEGPCCFCGVACWVHSSTFRDHLKKARLKTRKLPHFSLLGHT